MSLKSSLLIIVSIAALASIGCSSANKQGAKSLKSNLTKSLAKAAAESKNGGGSDSGIGGAAGSANSASQISTVDASCTSGGGNEASACSAEEEKAFETKLTSACGAELKGAFGNDWENGNYGDGQCAEFLTCAEKCDPCDEACNNACAESIVNVDELSATAQEGEAALNAYLAQGCLGALVSVGKCVEKLEIPACFTDASNNTSAPTTN